MVKIPVDSWVFNIASEILEFSEGRKEFGSFSSYKYLDSREGLITGYLVHYDNNFDFIAIDSVKVPKESLAHLKSEVERQSGKEVKAIVNIKTNEIIERNIIAWDEKLSQNKFYSMLEDIGKNSLKMLNENKTKLDIEKHFYKKYSLVPNKIWEYYKNSDTINKLLEKYKLNEDEEQKYVIYKKGKRIWKGHTTRDAAVSKAKELGADYCGIEHKGGDVETEYANLAKNENILNEDEETEIEQADDEVEMEKEGGDRFITKEELETPEDETDAEVPAEVTPVTEPASDISSPEGTPPIEDVGEPAEATDSETAKANIEMEYPDEPLKSTAIAFADSIVNDPKVYEPIRNLNWEGVYTNSEDVLKQADVVGKYGGFNKEVIKRLVDKLGDVAKYKLAREKGPVMYITIRDGNVDPVSVSGIKDLVNAREVTQTGSSGEMLIKW